MTCKARVALSICLSVLSLVLVSVAAQAQFTSLPNFDLTTSSNTGGATNAVYTLTMTNIGSNYIGTTIKHVKVEVPAGYSANPYYLTTTPGRVAGTFVLSGGSGPARTCEIRTTSTLGTYSVVLLGTGTQVGSMTLDIDNRTIILSLTAPYESDRVSGVLTTAAGLLYNPSSAGQYEWKAWVSATGTNPSDWQGPLQPRSGYTNIVEILAPEISFSPGTTLDANNVRLGTYQDLTLTITNTGSGTVPLIGLVNSLTGTRFTFVSGNTNFTLYPGESHQVVIRYTPTASNANDSDTGSFRVVSNDSDEGNVTINLKGNGAAPVAIFSQTSFDYGNRRVGTPVTQTVTTITNDDNNTNTTEAALTNIECSLSGSGASAYSIANCPATIDAGANANVQISFNPSARGSFDATLRVCYDGLSDPSVRECQDVTLSGTGIAPAYDLSPTTLAYGSRRVGSGTDLSVTLTNTGDDTASFTSATVTGGGACGDYTVTAGGGSGTIVSGGERDITVRFTPSARGARNCLTSLQITVEDPANESATTTLTVGLTGAGIAPVYPTPEESDGNNDGTLNFGTTNVGVPVTRTVTVRNTGDDDASNVRATIVGGNGCTQFIIISGGAGETLTSGTGVKVITVQFLASSIGDFTCSPSLKILGEHPNNENDTNYTIETIVLQASAGVPDIELTGEPVALNFGNVRVGLTSAPQSVIIKNVGGAPLSVTSYTGLAAPYTISSHGVGAPPYTLAPNGSNTVQITCTPAARGSANGTLVINSNDPDEPTKTVDLSCTGIAPVPGVAPTGLNFGNVPVGGTSTTQSVTVSNTGDDSMTIESISLVGAHASQFSIVNNTCGGGTLAPSNTCQVEVRFSPTSFGPKSATLRVRTETTSSETGRQNNDVDLSGTGTNAPEIALLPSDTGPGDPPHLVRDFGSVAVGSSFDLFFEIRNIGTANLTGTVNAPSSPFSIVSGGGAFNLRPNATRRVTLRCRPTTVGEFIANLTITGINDTDETTKTIELRCRGTVPDIDVTPTTIDFGNVRRGTSSPVQNVTIENEGAAPLTLTNVFISANPAVFTVIRPAGCPRFPCTIQPGDSLVFGVRARPDRLGVITGNLRITSNDPDEATVNVSLRVTGTLTAGSLSSDLLTQNWPLNVTDLQIRQTANAIEFKVAGTGLTGVQVELYDMRGRKVAEAAADGGMLRLELLTRESVPLANGVYLYVITYKGPDGLVIRDRIEKLVLLR